ncbi:MAG: DUF3298 domain-containing protein [Bacillota bacterium]
MKRLVVFMLLLSFILVGCSNSDGEVKRDTIQASELTDKYVLESKTEEYPKGSQVSTITYPIVKDLIDKRIEDKVNGVIQKRMEDYKQLLTLSEEGTEEVLEVRYETTYKTKEKLSLKFFISSYIKNTEFSDNMIDSLNFDLNSGEILVLRELFKVRSKYDKTLNSIIAKKIKNVNVKLLTDFKGIEANQVFYLKENSLVIYYQTYVYTSPEDGPLEIDITFDEVKDMLRDQGMLQGNKQSNSTIDKYNKTIDENTKPFEALFFIQKNIENVTKDQALTMILSFEEIQEGFIGKYEEELLKDDIQNKLIDAFEYNFDEKRLDDISDQTLKSFIKEIIDGGYMILNVEGSYMPVQDYSKLEKFCEYLPEDLRDFIKIKAAESRQLKALGVGASISFSQIEDRIIEIEKYMAGYPNSIKEYEVNKLYLYSLYTYLFGFNNNPAFDYETNKVNEGLVKSYRNFVSENKDSETAKMIENYLGILEKNNFLLCEEVENFRKSVTSGMEEE